MTRPDWLSEGETLRDGDGERWVIRSIDTRWVELGHTDRGSHRILREDLHEWVESGEWTPAG